MMRKERKRRLFQSHDTENKVDMFRKLPTSLRAQIAAEQRYKEELLYRDAITFRLSAFHCINVTQNYLEESKSISGQWVHPCGKLTQEMLKSLAQNYIADELDAEMFCSLFSLPNLAHAYKDGKKSVFLEYRRLMQDEQPEWVRTTANLMRRPTDNDLMAFVYTENIHQRRIAESVIECVVNTDYDYVAYVDGKKDSYVLYSQKEGKDAIPPQRGLSYTGMIQELIENYAPERERQDQLEAFTLKRILAELEKKDRYVCFVDIVAADKRILNKKLSYTYIDRERCLIMLTRTDVTDILREESRKNSLLKMALKNAEQANEAKSEVMSRISHEMRTPVNVISGLISILLKNAALTEDVAGELEKIDASARFLRGLITDILDMTKIESGKMVLRSEPIEFPLFLKTICGMTESQARVKNVRFQVKTCDLRSTYVGDCLKLQQLLLNLLSNAVKFTPENGIVSFWAEQKCEKDGKAALRFIIEDTGIGMSEDFLLVMFDPFVQGGTAEENISTGTGLGLAICKSIVSLMGGSIRAESQLGRGTKFVVELVLDTEKNREVHRAGNLIKSGKKKYDFTGRRILLVDDKRGNVEVARLLLEFCGISVEMARDGEEALERFQKAPHYYFDAILMDVRMPVMDGWTAAEYIRHAGKADSQTIPIVAMTASAFDEDIEKARRCGMNAHLAKPVHAEQLYGILDLLFSPQEII